MPSLPIPGGDDDIWGVILNDFLDVSLNPDGTLDAAAVELAIGMLGGDLSGTLPDPTVAKVNGVAVTGTPSTGEALVATSSVAATWQPVAGSSGAAVVRNTSSLPATAAVEEITLLTGSTAAQTLTLPVPGGQATNVVKNYSSVAVGVGPGVLNGFFGFISLQPGDSVTLSYSSPTWYPTGTMQRPAAPVFDVVDFGADPTGTNDSAPAIQAAINVCGQSAGTVLLNGATFKINSTLMLGNANLFETTVRAGSSGTTLNLATSVTVNTESQGASIASSGFVWVYTGSLVATKVTYTSVTGSGASTQLLGCSPNMATLAPITGAAVGQGAPSTTNNITFTGIGLPGSFAAGDLQTGTTLKWGGAGSGVMMKMFGPVSGMWVKNIAFNGSGTAGTAIEEIATQGCRFDNIQVTQAGRAWYLTGNSGAWGGGFNGLINGGTLNNVYDNISVTVAGTNFATGFYFNGITTGLATGAWGSGGPAFLRFTNLNIVLLDPGGGNDNIGWVFGFCDDIAIEHVRMYPLASAGTNVWADYDYTVGGEDPSNIVFDYVTHYATKTPTFLVAPPVSSSQWPFAPNVIRHVESGFASPNDPSNGTNGPGPALANPNIFNLRWETAGGERVVLTRVTADTYFTTATARQISATDPVMLYVEETISAIWSCSIQNTASSPSQTLVVKGSANPGVSSFAPISVPAGWFVTITCTAMTDLTVSAITRV